MTSNEIRGSFLRYFETNGHRVVPSSPLVPADDPTLLFTNAGMNQFKDVFLGRDRRGYTRAASSQKCMRVSGKHNDLDNVGPSLRHHTFFEMLGNFSFGDYFKTDAIRLAWILLTEVWLLPADRLVVSVFKGEGGIPRDEEAYGVWRTLVPPDRILELGADDNFWQMGDTGPCGRCSEIYYVRAAGNAPEIEIWNNVFMEFDRGADGTLTPLPAPSIDTGMGLERITAVLQKRESNYDTDLFTPLLQKIGEMADVKYGRDADRNISMRVVADHIRATTFLIGDGVLPSNEWRGYVLRKVMRRAMRHGKHLGLNDPFLHQLVAVLAHEMGDAYPELRTNREMIEKTILAEEKRFQAVLRDGLPRLEAEIAKALNTAERVLPGDAAFRLYDTFGMPYEFIEDTAATHDVRVDQAGFDQAMDRQRTKARVGSAFATDKTIKRLKFPAAVAARLMDYDDVFRGYDTTDLDAKVLALFRDHDEAPKYVHSLREGEHGYVALSQTPFYREAGGQVSDTGTIVGPSGEATVHGIARHSDEVIFRPRFQAVSLARGSLSVGELVTASVDSPVRDATRRNHTATHLVHAALRQVLGAHVKQAGSLVAPDRLRFDFVHVQPVTREELCRIERMVNEEIIKNTPVQTEVRPTDEAIAAGAMALFGEKYGSKVRVVSVPGVSMELCGGTHVRATGDIGLFAIVAEGGIAAGTRRIEALTGMGAVRWAQDQREALQRVIDVLRVNPDQAVEAIEKLQAEAKRLGREVTELKTKLAMGGGASSQDAGKRTTIGPFTIWTLPPTDLDRTALRNLIDKYRSMDRDALLIGASNSEGKAQFVVSVPAHLTDRIKAGDIAKKLAPIVGGAGGGRPDFAEAGGKQADRIDDLLKAAPKVVEQLTATQP